MKYKFWYRCILYISYILTIITIFGLSTYAPQYLKMLREIIKIFITCFLIVKFNPFIKKDKMLTLFEREIVFSAAIFLLLTTSLILYVEYYINKYTNNTFKPVFDIVIPKSKIGNTING